MGNKILKFNHSASSRQAQKRALELEFTNMRGRYFTPLSLRDGFLKQKRRSAKPVRALAEAQRLSVPRSKRKFVEAMR